MSLAVHQPSPRTSATEPLLNRSVSLQDHPRRQEDAAATDPGALNLSVYGGGRLGGFGSSPFAASLSSAREEALSPSSVSAADGREEETGGGGAPLTNQHSADSCMVCGDRASGTYSIARASTTGDMLASLAGGGVNPLTRGSKTPPKTMARA